MISLPGLSEKLPIDLYRFLGQDRYNIGFDDIFGLSYENLGFSNLINTAKNNTSLNEVLRSLVLMRVFSPTSKLRSCCLLKERFNKLISHKQVLKKEERKRQKILDKLNS